MPSSIGLQHLLISRFDETMTKHSRQFHRPSSALAVNRTGQRIRFLGHHSTFTAVLSWLLATMLCSSGFVAEAADAAKLKLTDPKPHQVVQRTGTDPATGHAAVRVRGEKPNGVERAVWESRVVGRKGATGRGTDWTKLETTVKDSTFEATVRVAAGGWYRLEVRCRIGDDAVAVGQVEPIGVGEVFVVAGQSYATNCNDERFKVTDPHERVVAFDSAKETWGVANDPQPTPDGSDGGSIWPPLGDALAKELRVPIGFANVAVGGTSSMQWMPEEKLHPRLVQAGENARTIPRGALAAGGVGRHRQNDGGEVRRESQNDPRDRRDSVGLRAAVAAGEIDAASNRLQQPRRGGPYPRRDR